jgi:methyl-accepting chemotaxis protein
MREVVNMISKQENAVKGINAAVQGLVELSEETNQQTELLHGLSGSLNGAAGDLNNVVEKFKL